MPHFNYSALKRDGTPVKATEFAENLTALEQALRNRQLILVEAKKVKLQAVNKTVVTRFITQFAPLIEGSVAIDKALDIVARDSRDAAIASLARQIHGAIKQGMSLSDAISATGSFDQFDIALIRAGEASGRLSETLQNLEMHYTERAALRREITSALLYPVILVVISILSLVLLSTYVIPLFEDLFADRQDALPGNAKIVFAISHFLSGIGLYVLAGLILLIVLFVHLRRTNTKFKEATDLVMLQLPFMKTYISQVEGSNIMTVLGLLTSNGVQLVPSLELTEGVVKSIPLQKGMRRATQDVKRGAPLLRAVESVPAFPGLAKRFIAVGEETGNLGPMLTRAGQLLATEVQTKLKRFSVLIGPIMILFIAGMIGFVVMSMLSAVYSFSDVV